MYTKLGVMFSAQYVHVKVFGHIWSILKAPPACPHTNLSMIGHALVTVEGVHRKLVPRLDTLYFPIRPQFPWQLRVSGVWEVPNPGSLDGHRLPESQNLLA